MLTLLAAAAAATATPAADPDVRCMAAYLFAVGQISEDPKSSAEDKAAATTMVMYFFGKVRVRLPGTDIRSLILPLVETPTYLTEQLKPDLERCGAEYEQRGKELEAFGGD